MIPGFGKTVETYLYCERKNEAKCDVRRCEKQNRRYQRFEFKAERGCGNGTKDYIFHER